MLSSLFQETHRVGFGANTPQGRNDTIPAEVELVQEILQTRGWHTIGITGGGYMSAAFGFSRGFNSFSDKARTIEEGTAKLLKQIKSVPADGRPIFAMYHTYQIHSPYQPPRRYQTIFGEFESNISPTNEILLPMQRDAGTVLTEEDFDYLESQYDGEIRYTDDVLQDFFAQLESTGFLDNSLVIITSDHGEEFGDHGGLLHRASLYEELLHIPLILVGSMIPAGVVDPQLVSLVDITPTIMEIADLPTTPGMEGMSLLNRPPPASWSKQRSFAQYTSRYYSVRTPRWKLIQQPKTNRLQLFDLHRDPKERRNVVKAFPEIGERLLGDLNRWRRRLPQLDLAKDRTQELSAETIEELKALGYIED